MRGACAAAVGKHAPNLDSDTVDSVLVSADEKSVKNLDARGPGVRATGGKGGGEGESCAGAGIFVFFFSPLPAPGGKGMVWGLVGG